MKKEIIERGDRVDIHFSTGESIFNAEVLYPPCTDGDYWRIREKDGSLVYIQKFEVMRLLSPKDKE